MTDSAPAPDSTAPARGRSPVLLGLVAAASLLVLIMIVVAVRVIGSTATPPLGETASVELQLGSCLGEHERDLDAYTVVDCSAPHPQQVVAPVDLTTDLNSYTELSAVTTYADAVCERFLEYDLYVTEGLEFADYEMVAIRVPTAAEFDDGQTEALCSIVRADGANLTESLYRRMPN